MTRQRKGPPITVDASRCTGCLICQLRCSLRFERAFNPAKAALQVQRVLGSASEYKLSFTAKCDHCGICAQYCSYGALTQARKGGPT